ncbi:Uncharacterised protein [Klebsiella oxytoca]|nr:Uncharacterised protein [Klebsiella oxytoca]
MMMAGEGKYLPLTDRRGMTVCDKDVPVPAPRLPGPASGPFG